MKYFYLILLLANSLTVVQAQTVPWVPPVYDCDAKKDGELRIAKDPVNGHVGVAAWYCDTPKRITLQYYCGDPTKLPAGFFALVYAKIATLFKSNLNRPCTEDELQLVQGIINTEPPLLVVTASTIYDVGPNNTVGNPILSKSIPVGTPCRRKRLQDATGKGTMYFETTQGYALCKFNGIISK